MFSQRLKVIVKKKMQVGDKKISYVVLEDDKVYFSQISLNQYTTHINPNFTPFKSKKAGYVDYINNDGLEDVGVPIDSIIGICTDAIEAALKSKVTENYSLVWVHLLSSLSEAGVNDMKSKIISEAKKKKKEDKTPEVRFDDLLAGLLKVPPPKKGK